MKGRVWHMFSDRPKARRNSRLGGTSRASRVAVCKGSAPRLQVLFFKDCGPIGLPFRRQSRWTVARPLRGVGFARGFSEIHTAMTFPFRGATILCVVKSNFSSQPIRVSGFYAG